MSVNWQKLIMIHIISFISVYKVLLEYMSVLTFRYSRLFTSPLFSFALRCDGKLGQCMLIILAWFITNLRSTTSFVLWNDLLCQLRIKMIILLIEHFVLCWQLERSSVHFKFTFRIDELSFNSFGFMFWAQWEANSCCNT
jgi:hypothetical protein